MDLPTVTQARLDDWQIKRRLVQDIFPELSKEQREFLMTGYTPEDWKAIFPPNCGNCRHWQPQGENNFDDPYICISGEHKGKATEAEFTCTFWQEE